MTTPPRLEAADIEQLVRRSFQEGQRKHWLLAVHGTGASTTVSVETVGSVAVVPVESELDLRDRLPPLDATPTPTVYLLPWAGELPLDLRGRFARRGRIESFGRDQRLARMFSVLEIDRSVLGSALAKVVLDEGFSAPAGTGKLRIGRLWSLWLGATFGLALDDDRPSLDAMLAWCAFNEQGPSFAARAEAPALRAEWAKLGGTEQEAALRVLLAAWEGRRGRALFGLAILAEAAIGDGEKVGWIWLRQRARAIVPDVEATSLEPGLRALGRVVGDALRRLEKSASPAIARQLVLEADTSVDDPGVRAALGGSPRLPVGWTTRLAALGEALELVAEQPRADHTRKVVALRRALEAHAWARDEDRLDTIRRAEMAARLAFWLFIRKPPAPDALGSPYADVEQLARWYVGEGGYVDRARRTARGTGGADPFERGVAAVVHAADEARAQLDRRFARALPAWVAAGRPAERVLPLDRVFEKLVVPFLEENEDRKVLVVLLDGMAWAQAVEILESLGEWPIPWGPLQWHWSTRGGGNLPVTLANLPSVTQVSRSGFFAGALVPSGREHDTQKDPARFRDQPRLRRFGDGNAGPRLLLRADGHTRGGAASQEALSLIEDTRQRLVAIVLNAIDDSLKANPGVRHPWRADTITALGTLLAKAREVGRAVLLASDHGHVPVDRLQVRPASTTGGARWREVGADTALGEDEVSFPAGPHVWTPKGASAIALLADDTSKFGGASHAGEHGGATLAEMVAPCLLVGWMDPVREERDALIGTRPFPVPAWWYLDETLVDGKAAAAPPPGPKRKKTPAHGSPQLSLTGLAPPPPPEPPPAKAPPPTFDGPLVRAFRECQVLKNVAASPERKTQAVAVLAFLEAHDGRVGAAAFATHVGVFPRNVPGLVDALRSVFNLDAYPVLGHEPHTKEVVLDLAKVRQLFELGGAGPG